MKGLRKVLTPFAPDQSGAVSVLYELGGIIVICDAGGCAGNVCGFDEPRWFTHKSAVFSAGLRDMDAILGRDDRLVTKLVSAAEKLDAQFAAIIGTPVPSVIGTDYHALRRMAQRRTKLPILTVDTTGMALSDVGAEKAYLELFRTFATEKLPIQPGKIGVLGANPLDLSDLRAGERLTAALQAQGWREVCCYGMGAGLDAVRAAASAERNLVVSPSGLAAARELERRFGTPFEVDNPLSLRLLPTEDWSGKRVLVVQQQVTANALRRELERQGAAEVVCATWFMKKAALQRPVDLHLTEEDQFEDLVRRGWDAVIADPTLWPLTKGCALRRVDAAEFAVSGRLLP